MVKDKKNEIVKISNSLAEAKYRLSLQAQKLYLYAVGEIDESSEDFNIIKFNLSDFALRSGSDLKRLYKDIDKITDELMRSFFKIKKSENSWVKHSLMSKCSYDHGELTIKFDKDMRPHLLALKGAYLRHLLDVPIKFKSKYSIRGYQLVKANQYRFERHKIKYLRYELEELKEILGIKKGQYKDFRALRRVVLDVMKDEINEKSELEIDYEKVMDGKKVVGIDLILVCADKDLLFYDIPSLRAEMGLEGEKFSDSQIAKLYEMAIRKTQDGTNPYEYVRVNYQWAKRKDSVRNMYAYLMTALENDYAIAAGQLKLFDEYQ